MVDSNRSCDAVIDYHSFGVSDIWDHVGTQEARKTPSQLSLLKAISF